jgi:hypothetical protein
VALPAHAEGKRLLRSRDKWIRKNEHVIFLMSIRCTPTKHWFGQKSKTAAKSSKQKFET